MSTTEKPTEKQVSAKPIKTALGDILAMHGAKLVPDIATAPDAMQATQHTPGPWKVTPVTIGGIVEPRIDQEAGGLAVGIAMLPSLSNMRGDVKLRAEEICANARLIAAAPDLLAAGEAVYALNAAGRITVNDSAAYKAIVDLCVAIAAATGEEGQ